VQPARENRLGWSVEEALRSDPELEAGPYPHKKFEPTLDAVLIAQVESWRNRGLEADAIIGVCAGEPAAAYCAGALTLDQAMRVACAISGHAEEGMDLPGRGGGVAARLTVEQGLRLQEATNGGVFAAMEWHPDRTLFTGHLDAIDQVLPELTERGIPHSILSVVDGFAAHSPLLDSLEPAFVGRLEGLLGREPQVPLYSGWAAGLVNNRRFDAEHWWRVITDPVFVARTVRTMMLDGYTRFLEISLTPDTVYPVRAVADSLSKDFVHKSSLACLSEATMPFEPNRSPEASTGKKASWR